MVNTPTMFADNDSDSSSRPKPSRKGGDLPPKPPKKARRRDFPSEQLVERNGDIDLTPALQPADLLDLEAVLETATPEQFQQLLALKTRKMLVKGLRDIPSPKSIKEMQVMITLFRQMEGIEARDRGGGAPPAGFLPRTIRRGVIGGDAVVEAEVVDTESADSLFPESESEDESEDEEKEFEI